MKIADPKCAKDLEECYKPLLLQLMSEQRRYAQGSESVTAD